MKTVRVSRDSQLVEKDGKYFYHAKNHYNGAEELIELVWDEEGKAHAKGVFSGATFTKEKVELLFALRDTPVTKAG